MSFSSVPRPGAPASLRHRPSRPFWPLLPVALCARPQRRPRRSPLGLQFYRWYFGDQPAAQLLRHSLRVRSIQAQLQADLPVRQVQAHEGEAQHPHPQRLVVPGQHRAGEIVEAIGACLAPVALPTGLRVVVAVADHRIVVAGRAPDALRPAALAHKGEALGVVHQADRLTRSDTAMTQAPRASRSATPVPAFAPAVLSPAPRSQPHHPGTQ